MRVNMCCVWATSPAPRQPIVAPYLLPSSESRWVCSRGVQRLALPLRVSVLQPAEATGKIPPVGTMEASSKASSQQHLWKDAEDEKAKKSRCYMYQRATLLLVLVVLVLVPCVFSLRYLWRPSLGKASGQKPPKRAQLHYWHGSMHHDAGMRQSLHAAPLSLQVYDHPYKAFVDGVETDSLMEIDPNRRIMTFRTGNGSKEIVEVHDFKNGITGIRFTEHQRCFIRTQTRSLPTATEAVAEDTALPVRPPRQTPPHL
ncbi:unnamed protein product [Tetraodon nigroviridis]|uniref:(spotted green pufferfish) hypothetical protein n=1 Tax=Tetraodon nigroviridis TaxID=99883 RepID=Q4RTD8_TETNG|nr:unnamed protein product [Tetraodon nigroviridis]